MAHLVNAKPLTDEITGFDEAAFRAVLKAVDAKQPDAAAVAKLQKYIRDYPILTELGDFQSLTLERIAERTSGGKATSILVQANYEKVKQAYGFAAAPPLERALIEHILLCFVRLVDTEWCYEHTTAAGGLSIAQADWWERKLNYAQHRYLKAVEALVRIRKLGLNVQINIADKQIVNP